MAIAGALPKTSGDGARFTGCSLTMAKLGNFLVRYLYAFFSCIYLFTAGIFWGRNRTLLYQIAAHFGPLEVEPYKPKTILPVTNISAIVPEAGGLRILSSAGVFGNVTPLELIVINLFVHASRPQTIFEIGTFDGRTTLNMAANAPREAIVYTLDLPESEVAQTRLAIAAGDETYIMKEASGTRFKGTPHEHKIRQLLGDSAKFDFSRYRRSVDLVFVDGAHSYDYVVNDSLRALDMLRKTGGIILWHDYGTWDGVTDALNEMSTTREEFRGILHIADTTLACLVKGTEVRERLFRGRAKTSAH